MLLLDNRHTSMIRAARFTQVPHALLHPSRPSIHHPSKSHQRNSAEQRPFLSCCETLLEHVRSYPYFLGYGAVDNLEARG